MLTFSSDHNWTYNSLSGVGAIRKWFLRAEWFHTFSCEDAFRETNEGDSGEDDINMHGGW